MLNWTLVVVVCEGGVMTKGRVMWGQAVLVPSLDQGEANYGLGGHI